MIGRTVRNLGGAVWARSSHGTTPGGANLPPRAFRMGGRHFRSDEAFVASAVADVDRLVSRTGLNPDSTLLDWGCGAGRLAIGVAERFGRIGLYHGVDVQKWLVAWAERNLGRREGFRFTHVDAANERYNPSGSKISTIPAESGAYDVFYAYSVFSHMGAADVSAYLDEVARLLVPNGAAFFTAFVEKDVEPQAENPSGYGPLTWSGPLHCVRFEQGYFFELITGAGLTLESFEHGAETDGQSLFLARKR